MGMYTELIFGAEVDMKDGSTELNALRFLLGERIDEPELLPNHPFFIADRWKYIATMSSFYFGVCHSQIYIAFEQISKSWVCSFRANLKNYDREIEKFLDWIKPYITQGSGTRNFYAIVCYEEASEPTIYYKEEYKDETTA